MRERKAEGGERKGRKKLDAVVENGEAVGERLKTERFKKLFGRRRGVA